jgi:PIN domain nuclease of toxin-antitoxin system
MRLLLDTHVFLWFIAGDHQLPKSFRGAIEDLANEKFLSVASIWEAVIKCQTGKLHFPAPPETYLPQQRDANGIQPLPIEEAALLHLGKLPPLHRDPFDRILIAQAIQHNLQILTVDSAVRSYGLQLFSTP